MDEEDASAYCARAIKALPADEAVRRAWLDRMVLLSGRPISPGQPASAAAPPPSALGGPPLSSLQLIFQFRWPQVRGMCVGGDVA